MLRHGPIVRSFIREFLRESSDVLGDELVDPEYNFPVEVPESSKNTLKLLQRVLMIPETGIYDFATEKAWDDLLTKSGKVSDEDIGGATARELAQNWEKNSQKVYSFFGQRRSYTPGLKGMLKFVSDFRQYGKESPQPGEEATTCGTSFCTLPDGSLPPHVENAVDPVIDRSTMPAPNTRGRGTVTSLAGHRPGKRIAGGVNFDRVSGKNNYRAAFSEDIIVPSVQFFEDLKSKFGVETIVTLNADEGGKDIPGYVRAAGLESIYIPSSYSSLPNSDEWAQIQAALEKGNTLVHCAHGADRTGGVVGRWNVVSGAMSTEEAIADAGRHDGDHKPLDTVEYYIRHGENKNKRKRE